MKRFGKELTKLQEKAVKLTERAGHAIIRISEENTVPCEWCDKTTRAVYIGYNTEHGHMQGVCFEDENFHLQNEWCVCGTCENCN